MLVALQALNNIITHRILFAHCGILSNSFQHQITDNFNKLIKQDGNKNTVKIATPILLVIKMHIGPTRLLEDGAIIVNYDSGCETLSKVSGCRLR